MRWLYANNSTGLTPLHLTSAPALGSTDLTVAVWDKRLHAGAAAVGLAAASAALG